MLHSRFANDRRSPITLASLTPPSRSHEEALAAVIEHSKNCENSSACATYFGPTGLRKRPGWKYSPKELEKEAIGINVELRVGVKKREPGGKPIDGCPFCGKANPSLLHERGCEQIPRIDKLRTLTIASSELVADDWPLLGLRKPYNCTCACGWDCPGCKEPTYMLTPCPDGDEINTACIYFKNAKLGEKPKRKRVRPKSRSRKK